MQLPALSQLGDRRQEARFSVPSPPFLWARFLWGRAGERACVYDATVLDYSTHGLALILGEENRDFYERIETGDRISQITLFAESALTLVEGIVRHKTILASGLKEWTRIIGFTTNTSPYLCC